MTQRNSRVVSHKKTSRKAFLQSIGAGVVVAALAACSEEEPVQTRASSNPASDNGGSPVVTTDILDYNKNKKFGLVLDEEIRQDSFGEYRQLKLSPESVLLEDKPDAVEEHVYDAFDENDVREAQKMITPFAVEQNDSLILWDNSDENKEIWIEENIEKVSPDAREEAANHVRVPGDPDYGLFLGNAMNWKQELGSPIYTPDQPRLVFTNARISHIDTFLDEAVKDEPRLRFDYEFKLREDIQLSNGSTAIAIYRTERQYALKKAADQWFITAWRGRYVYDSVLAEEFDPDSSYAQQDYPDLGW